MPCPHIAAEDLAAYLEGRTELGERARIELHLIRCDECLDDVLATLECLPRSPRRPPEQDDSSQA